ncbi:MAG: flavodoxin domain-containing protein [Gracilimonas sp.]|nr:flavodoxin domain-containing protein [Gracilimonas sp.]
MKLLIIYGTVEGQTRKICERIKNEAKLNGHTVSLNNSTGPNLSPFGFDAIIIASSVHNEKFQDSIEQYAGDYAKVLNNIVGVFVTVSLTAANDEPEGWKELEEITNDLLSRTGWHPTFIEHVAGAIRYSKYNYFKKFIVRNIAGRNGTQIDNSDDHEFTDWEQVNQILKKIEKAVSKISKVQR